MEEMKSKILQALLLHVFWSQLLFQTSRAQSADSCSSMVTSRDDCLNANCHHGRCVDGYNRYWCACDEGYTDLYNCLYDNRVYYNGTTCEDIYRKMCADRAATDPCTDDGDSSASGVYLLRYSGTPFRANCFFNPIPGLPYTMIQRRSGCETPFYRNWTEYERGFGDPSLDYWLGNDIINQITTANQRTILRIELIDWDWNECYEEYDNFKIAGAQDKYRLLSVGNASGTCGDSLSYQVGSQFTTYDQDNDNAPYDNCAQKYQGAWWYNQCMHSNLNGLFVDGGNIMYNGICWKTGKGFGYSYRIALMLIKKA